jgi:hypothetical protein
MKRLTLIILALLWLLPGAAQASPTVGWPTAAGPPPDLPYPTIFIETQDWWQPSLCSATPPGANFAFTSSHDHLGIAFGQGEQTTRVDGQWQFPFFAQLHNFPGGHGKLVRGGGWLSDTLPSVPAPENMKNPATENETWRGLLTNTLNPSAGLHEQRFTFDTTSPQGKRMYQSFGVWTYVDAPGQAQPSTGRGWYATTGYTNITIKTPWRATAPLRAGQTITYSLAQGAKWAFAYTNANIHAGDKGTVIFENRLGSSGTFTIPADATVLTIGAWEPASDGCNAGVLKVPIV